MLESGVRLPITTRSKRLPQRRQPGEHLQLLRARPAGHRLLLQAVLPDARRVTLTGEGHNAERSAPGRLAEAISEFTEGEATA